MSGDPIDQAAVEKESKARRKRALNLLTRAKGTLNQLVALAQKSPVLCDAMFHYGDRRQRNAARIAVVQAQKDAKAGKRTTIVMDDPQR